MRTGALDKVEGLDPNTVNDVYLGCGLPGGESGFNMARVVNILNGMDDVPGTTLTGTRPDLAVGRPNVVVPWPSSAGTMSLTSLGWRASS